MIFYLFSLAWLLLLMMAGAFALAGYPALAWVSGAVALVLAVLSAKPWGTLAGDRPTIKPKGRSKAPAKDPVVPPLNIPWAVQLAVPVTVLVAGQLLYFLSLGGAHHDPTPLTSVAFAISLAGLVALLVLCFAIEPKARQVDRLAFGVRLFLGLAGLALFSWYAAFIWRSSFFGPDNDRIFCLFDDAMVSLRYARNLVLGHGLVWNTGERVEGFTNALMTLLMAVGCLIFKKTQAAVFAQVLGLLSLLVMAWLCRGIFLLASGIKDEGLKRRLGNLAFFLSMLYYPTAYWALMGMETGLLGALLWGGLYLLLRRGDEARFLPLFSVLLGLATWTRPDATAPALMLLAWRAMLLYRRPGGLAVLAKEALLFAIFPVSLTAFRVAYYGEWVPNTYYLKLTGLSMKVRLVSGLSFVQQFAVTIVPLLGMGIVGTAFNFNLRKCLLALLFLYILFYQYWVGGDPWLYWRMFSPFVPLLILQGLDGAACVFEKVLKPGEAPLGLLDRRNAAALMAVALVSLSLFVSNRQFYPELTFKAPAMSVDENRTNSLSALYLNTLFKPGAKVGCTWAGAIPYFSEAIGVDFLGKSDKKIAMMDASPFAGFNGMPSVPGHNKYNLRYSIEELKPDYIETFFWIGDDERAYSDTHYIRFNNMLIRKGSPFIRWSMVNIVDADVDPDTGVRAPQD
jgi:arabinofuranosyltransferase